MSFAWKSICEFILVNNSNLGPISQRLATIHPSQTTTTDRQTTHPAIDALHLSVARQKAAKSPNKYAR